MDLRKPWGNKEKGRTIFRTSRRSDRRQRKSGHENKNLSVQRKMKSRLPAGTGEKTTEKEEPFMRDRGRRKRSLDSQEKRGRKWKKHESTGLTALTEIYVKNCRTIWGIC